VFIYVRHSGPKAIFGFCATINNARSHYWSGRIVQDKDQEIVGTQLKVLIERAFRCFADRCGDYPDHIIIYRDGVADRIHKLVLD
jgi:hypothetical protein